MPPLCPCGGVEYETCCGRFLTGAEWPATPEETMRSRYTAFALGNAEHLWRTWHPRTRPPKVTLDPEITWTSLRIVRAGEDTVEFQAHFRGPAGAGRMREHSQFARRAGRWFYLGPV